MGDKHKDVQEIVYDPLSSRVYNLDHEKLTLKIKEEMGATSNRDSVCDREAGKEQSPGRKAAGFKQAWNELILDG